MARILFPVGRMIGGSVDKLHPRTESDGKTPKLDRDGKPMMSINFGVAIPKEPGHTHWAQTAWGAEIYNIAKAAYPVLHQTQSFAWKIVDGDSTMPNKNGKKPCDQVGYAGHWVIWFSQGWAPKLVNANGTVELPTGAIVPGYYVQVLGDIDQNGAQPPNTPGMYMNPVAVALAGEGDKIETAVDTTAVGFGAAPLPPGARPVQPVVPGFPAPGAAVAPFPAPASGATSVTTSPSSIPVKPSAAFMAPPPPPAAPQHVMTPKANGATYDAFIGQGWTDDTLRANGYML